MERLYRNPHEEVQFRQYPHSTKAYRSSGFIRFNPTVQELGGERTASYHQPQYRSSFIPAYPCVQELGGERIRGFQPQYRMQAPSYEHELPQSRSFEDDHDDSDDISLAKEMLNAGIPRGRVKELFTGKIKESRLDALFDDSPGRKNGNMLQSSRNEIEELVNQAKAPDDFIDPLFLQLMEDPVVLSSGYVVDRGTVIDDEGNLKFSRCPFSRKILRLEVYPATEKKLQIEQFKAKRDHAISSIAKKLIADGKYRSFHDVLDAVEDYLRRIGDVNYLPLTRELANIWSGFHESCPMLLLVEGINPRKPGDKWHCALQSAPLDEKVRNMLVSIESLVQKGRGFQKPHLSIVLYNDNGVQVERVSPFEVSHHGKFRLCTYRMFDKHDPIVSKARRGSYYQLEYLIENSHGNPAQLEGWMCKIFPANLSQPSYRMRDGDGEEGLYMGKVDSGEAAHGKGVLEYDDGKRFVGKFHHGSMVDGVLYRGSHTRFTMRKGKWSRVVDKSIIDEYPPKIIVYDNGGTRKDQHVGSRETLHNYPKRNETEERPWMEARGIKTGRERKEIVDDGFSYLGNNRKEREDEDRYSTNSRRQHMHIDNRRDHGTVSSERKFSSRRRTPRRRTTQEPQDPRKQMMMQQKQSENMEKLDRRDNATYVNESERFDSTGSTKDGVISVLGSLQMGKGDRMGYLLSTKEDDHTQDISDLSLSEFPRQNKREKERSLPGLHNSEFPRHNQREKERSLPQFLTSEHQGQKLDSAKFTGRNERIHGDSLPTFLFVDQFKKEAEGGKWMTLVQSRCLRDKVGSIITSAELFTDENFKSMIGLTLYDDRGEMVERCNLFMDQKKRNKTESLYRLLDGHNPVVAKAIPGYFYRLEYAIGLNTQDTINVEGLSCKIFPQSLQVPSYRMADPEGERGMYMGTVDMNGEANGQGSLEYDNGCTFLGTFKSGEMMSGVHYRGKKAFFTMKDKKWTESLDTTVFRQYPFRNLLLEPKSTQQFIYKDSDHGDEEKSLLQKCCASYD